MEKTKCITKDIRTHVEYVPRRLQANVQKLKPFVHHEQLPPITTNSALALDSLRVLSSKNIITNPSTERNTGKYNSVSKTNRLLSSNIVVSISPSSDNTQKLKTKKDSSHRLKNWYNHLTPKQKLLLKIIVIILIISAVVVAIILAVYFTVIRRKPESSFVNITVSACSTLTCIGKETPYSTPIITALYSFDGNYNDLTAHATGTPYGSPSFSGSLQGYVSQAVYFPSSPQSYIQIPNINLASQSFTLQAWLLTGSLTATNEFGIFGQCDSSSICLSLSLRSARFALAFDSMNSTNDILIGASLVSSNNWVHVTVVYDAIQCQQQIYVNGRIDALSNGVVNAFQGISASSTTTIGRTSSFTNPNSFYVGRIDHLTVTAGVARNAFQVLNDASLVVYYPFDAIATWNDYSVNLCNGILSGTTTIPIGRVGQAILFTSSTSYFQSQCFPKMRGGDLSFSISLWINPTFVTPSGSLVHISSNSTGFGSCYDLLAFTTAGNLIFQWITWPNTVTNALGPVILVNTWTHMAVVYGSANGVRLFVNGQFSASSSNTGTLNVQDTNSPLFITLGNVGSLGPSASVSCANGSIPFAPGSFTGSIDEFRLYNRELDSQELCVLANP